MKHIYIVAGWVSVALGIIGIVLPVMPTTCFMLLGAYFFSKGSPKLHQLLRACPKFGPIICEWEEYHVIRIHPKLMATGLIFLAGFVLFVIGLPLVWLTLTITIMFLVLLFIWSRPSTIEASLERRAKRLAHEASSQRLK
jgi:uncharacterized membrane protein YbaN (DUF454 family)